MQAILLTEVEGLGEAGAVVTRRARLHAQLPRCPAASPRSRRPPGSPRSSAARSSAASPRSGPRPSPRSSPTCSGRTILTLKAKAGDDGRLFGSITSADVATAIEEARGVRVDRRHITVEPPIRALGTYSVPVELAPGLTTEVKTIVSPLLD